MERLLTADSIQPRILVAPDSLKETIDASSAASAIAAGVREVLPAAEVVIAPIADGGEGTLEVLAASIPDLEMIEALVPGPRPDRPPIRARWGLGGDRRLAIVELAEASGLAHLEPADRDPLATGTAGVGHLLEMARSKLRRGGSKPSELLLAVGGSATVDGGLGAARALGMTVSGPHGAGDRSLVGADLEAVGAVQVDPGLLGDWAGVRLRLLGDVGNPLLGPDGAARVFGPQKGADERSIERLETGLRHWAAIMESLVGGRCDGPGTGAAGGVAVGLAPLLLVESEPASDLAGSIESGFEVVAETIDLARQLETADLVITSEGSLDRQSMMGKAVGRLVTMAEKAAVPVMAVPGTADRLDGASADRFTVIRSLVEEVGVDASWEDPAGALRTTVINALGVWNSRA